MGGHLPPEITLGVNMVRSMKRSMTLKTLRPQEGEVEETTPPLNLRVLGGAKGWTQHTVRADTVLGRDPQASDIHLPLPSISRRHLRLRPFEGGWAVEDLKTANGSWLNGRPLGRGLVPLPEGGILELGGGGVAIRFHIPKLGPKGAPKLAPKRAPRRSPAGSSVRPDLEEAREEILSLRLGNDRLSAALVKAQGRVMALERAARGHGVEAEGERALQRGLMDDVNEAFEALALSISTLYDPAPHQACLHELGLRLGELRACLEGEGLRRRGARGLCRGSKTS